ncbi:5'-methylthioadenosine/S-adenosylhomocysteine nucleosidase [uncultured Roseobacter sp.]|uniref:5'-methylthioadenosine/S-adenosylhomocysteine nucleosidase n=1 Tax=uncultured Roseobacter sp. TaxID=114847 RepID=UPI0026336D9A|nr:5'-methylthioadenosine/S-adenosylhomocysteine nucleosidase [uncultured Roseobacter sp.]
MRLIAVLALSALPCIGQAELLDDTPRIALMSAFPPEWIALQEGLTDPTEHKLNGVTFITGQLADKPVVIFLSGVSMVNAAMTTQLALNHFDIQAIAFSGIAGGVDPNLSIGDVVVPAQWGKYLEGVMARETDDTFSIPPWMRTDYAGFGMITTVPFGITTAQSEELDRRFWFDTDPELLAIATGVAADMTLADCNTDNACLSDPPEIILGGNGVSGSFFVDNADLREWAYASFDAQVLDMESAAVAHVAYANEVPFIAFRSLSDLAGGGDGANEMNTFMSLAASNAASVMRAFVAALD